MCKSIFVVILCILVSYKFVQLCMHFTRKVFNDLFSLNFLYKTTFYLHSNFETLPSTH